MEEILRSHLLALATGFAEAEGVSLRSLGKAIFNDNTFFTRIAEGNNFTIKSFDKAVQWFADRWPETADWPLGVDRPCSAAAAATESQNSSDATGRAA